MASSLRKKLEEMSEGKVTIPTSWERMLPEQVSKAIHDLQTEKIAGRHVDSVCRVGKGRFCGKIHYKEGYYYLETIHIDNVRDAMKKEGYTPRKNKDALPNRWKEHAEMPQKVKHIAMPNPRRKMQPLKRGKDIIYIGTAAA
ncbi:MAG: hypothetical protein WC087_02090 [Candidatus Paceibacterota bacterium]